MKQFYIIIIFFRTELRESIEYIKNGVSTINDLRKEFTVQANTTLEVYFNGKIGNLEGFFRHNLFS